MGQDSVVRIATYYGLDGPGIESWGPQDFLHPFTMALGATLPPFIMSTTSLSLGVKWPKHGTHHIAPKLKQESSL